METKHIKLSHVEAIFAKKELLHSELDILNVLRKFKNYKLLRKKELTLRNKIKSNLTSFRAKATQIQSSFPVEEAKKVKRIKPHEKRKNSSNHQGISDELEEIKAKLARLE